MESAMHATTCRCPLCGARLDATTVLAACDELIDHETGLLAGRCPFCQGLLEVRLGPDAIELGYRRPGGFEVVSTLACPGLVIDRDSEGLTLHLSGRTLHFTAD